MVVIIHGIHWLCVACHSSLDQSNIFCRALFTNKLVYVAHALCLPESVLVQSQTLLATGGTFKTPCSSLAVVAFASESWRTWRRQTLHLRSQLDLRVKGTNVSATCTVSTVLLSMSKVSVCQWFFYFCRLKCWHKCCEFCTADGAWGQKGLATGVMVCMLTPNPGGEARVIPDWASFWHLFSGFLIGWYF